MQTATVTCHTPGCVKDGESVPGVPISWEDEEGNTQRVDAVQCGACGQEITDVSE